MARKANWSQQEFELLLQNPELTDEELSGALSTRSAGAVGAVRDFAHSYHEGGDVSGLSQMMKRRLKQGSWVCARCGKVVAPPVLGR